MKSHPKNIKIAEYNYSLPEEKIARYPLPNRDDSKLIVYGRGGMQSSLYKNLPSFLESGDTLIFNNTKVVRARLFFEKNTGGKLEIFCLEPDERYPDIQTAMQQTGEVYWKCLVGGAAKWKDGTTVYCKIPAGNTVITAHKHQKAEGWFTIKFTWEPASESFASILESAGQLPLPPYMQRVSEPGDHTRYQTIYAEPEGSVAAPTAGLHFTTELFDALEKKGVEKRFVTLHVGAGTFKPVKSETLEEHEMHTEFLEVDTGWITQLAALKKNRIVCVGTTSLRTVESLYWMGVKTFRNPDISFTSLEIKQWDAYQMETEVSVEEALNALLSWMNRHGMKKLVIKTGILIAPGYDLKIADGLITNFHQPQSTLLLLIASIIGDHWKSMYAYALENDFRFLSYGDGCLLWRSS